jgi:hypothetical protein
MPEPIMFISHFQIKDGAYVGFERLSLETTRDLESGKPRTLAFLTYLDDGRSRVSFVHVFADAQSMDAHFEGARERSSASSRFLVPAGWEIYGTPSAEALDTLREAASAGGVTLSVQPAYLTGFLRLSPR